MYFIIGPKVRLYTQSQGLCIDVVIGSRSPDMTSRIFYIFFTATLKSTSLHWDSMAPVEIKNNGSHILKWDKQLIIHEFFLQSSSLATFPKQNFLWCWNMKEGSSTGCHSIHRNHPTSPLLHIDEGASK